ncbi:flagellar motor protein MotB [Sodalis ligni]|uniref:flagellar motor protein MotB n=1 Tax=Sodalis ligni TaxID=2697027 RepID=UPI001BDED495|nr:flagellar motor protein MotB [Sodalis ligni]QWA09099.1 flagellar motor protein MotB [Sodalis ligni]
MKNQPVVVIRKRRSSPGQAQHGGAWKIAYADFMTAMMAFFLVMWLLSIASPQELTTIAEYFRTPLNVALTGGPRSSTDSSPIPGGGDDPTRQQGDVHKSLDNLMEKLEKKRLNHLRERLDQLIESDPRLRVLRPQLLINMVQEGLQIQILDSQNRPMFETGSALVEPYMRDVLRGIAPILNDIPNKISISGHTDAAPYANGERGYSNWELSADRANASRRELISGGLAEGKILRVVGMSSTMSIAPKQPYAAINRRISLVVLNKQTEEMIEHENVQNPAVEVNGSKELSAQPALKEAADARRGASPATQANVPAPQVRRRRRQPMHRRRRPSHRHRQRIRRRRRPSRWFRQRIRRRRRPSRWFRQRIRRCRRPSRRFRQRIRRRRRPSRRHRQRIRRRRRPSRRHRQRIRRRRRSSRRFRQRIRRRRRSSRRFRQRIRGPRPAPG